MLPMIIDHLSQVDMAAYLKSRPQKSQINSNSPEIPESLSIITTVIWMVNFSDTVSIFQELLG